MTDLEETIAGLLATHYKAAGTAWRPNVGMFPGAPRDGFWRCSCGAEGSVKQHQRATTLHRRHVAREIARLVVRSSG